MEAIKVPPRPAEEIEKEQPESDVAEEEIDDVSFKILVKKKWL